MQGNGSSKEGRPLTASLQESLETLQTLLGPGGDVVFRPFSIGGDPNVVAAVVWCTSVTSGQTLSDNLLRALMLQFRHQAGNHSAGCEFRELTDLALPMGNPIFIETVDQAADHVLNGYVALLVDGCNGAVAVKAQDPHLRRAVTESSTETVVRGPRDSFVEHLETNLGLIRRRLPVPELRLEQRTIGRRTRTHVVVAYLDGLPKQGVVDEVRRRLDRIEIDGVLESAYLEEFIEDHPLSPFPTVEHTERPDKVVASILEGRVAILTGNSPYALMVPVSFAQFLQAAEDYYERYFFANSLRLLRHVAFLLALTLPSVWVAVTTYHHEMIPTGLYVALAGHREGVPWPAVVEALLMEIAFELLREAGVRLPRPVGQAISIVGGLVIGEAAIRAKIASPSMVIVVALTGIASFAIPAFNLAISLRLLRFPLMLLAATLGLHGVVVGLLMMLIHLLSLRSFGVPYLAPAVPAIPGDWKDAVFRAPWWAMKRRPGILEPGDTRRGGPEPGPGRDLGS